MTYYDEIPKGQLSTIILMTLTERDKYGYEIIDEVLNTTNGKISIKQPSLYSSLKRMEEQSLISSYWRDSDIGGRRHYYHLTDLGKKHLEKWKNGAILDSYKQDSQPATKEKANFDGSTTKVLQQENLFSLTSSSEKEQKQDVEKPKDEGFIQFDLFSNSTIVTPASDKNDEPKQEDYALPSLKSRPISSDESINSLKQDSENKEQYKIESFNYVKKVNKSFADNVKSVVDYEKKYVEEPEPKEQTPNNYAQNVEQDKNENSYSSENIALNKPAKEVLSENVLFGYNGQNKQINSSNSYNYEQEDTSIKPKDIILKKYQGINDSEDESEFKGSYFYDDEQNFDQESVTSEPEQDKTPIKEDDAVYITERLNPEDMPKPVKWEGRRFEFYVSGNSVAPDLKKSYKNTNYEDRIKDLYEKSKTNAENQKLEFIDNKVRPATYKDLQEFYSQQNIKFKPYQKSLKKSDREHDMVKVNKLNMFSALSVFAYLFIISLVAGVVFSFAHRPKLNHPLTFITLPALALVVFAYFLIVYLKSPQKRVALDLNKFKINWNIVIIIVLSIPIIFAINLICGFTFKDFIPYAITILYPCAVVLTYFAYYIVRRILLYKKVIL